MDSEVLPDSRLKLVFYLETGKTTRHLWPNTCSLELRMTLGTTLELELRTRNNDEQTVIITEALHTYFTVGDVHQVRVLGLDGCDYLDKVQDFTRHTQRGAIHFSGEVDRVYLDTTADCVIEDPVWQRKIHIKKAGSQSTIVWNPWLEKSSAMCDMGEDGYLSMVCVETANAAENTVSIEPGKEHRLWVSYWVEAF